jgi:hypothetical protein
MEIQWTKKICKELEACGAMIFPIVASRMQPPGWPDRIVVHKNWHGFIEFKGEHTAVRPVQAVVMKNLRKRGKLVYIAREPGLLIDPYDSRVVGEFDSGSAMLMLLAGDNCPTDCIIPGDFTN